MNESELKEKIDSLKPWFHNIRLDNLETIPGETKSDRQWSIIEPYLPKDLTGKDVVDLGCNAGYFSIKMLERGANVLGVDESKRYLDQAKFATDYLNFKMDFELKNVYDFALGNQKKFNFSFFFGVLYHLRYPLLVLDKLREFTTEKLFLHTLVRNPGLKSKFSISKKKIEIPENISREEDKIYDNTNFPKAFFIEKKLGGYIGNWWIFNESCMSAILRSSGFTNIKSLGSGIFVCDVDPNFDNSEKRFTDFKWVSPI